MRMFGYSKREIVGLNISTIVPQPLCAAHDSYLRNYVATGTEVRWISRVPVRHRSDESSVQVRVCLDRCLQRIMDTTRTLFGRHRMGYIFPIQLNVTRMDTEFAGIMHRIQSPDEYIMFLSQSMVVTAATQGSLTLLGVSVGLVYCVTALHTLHQRRWRAMSQVDVMDVDDNAVKLTSFVDEATLREMVDEQRDSAAATRQGRRESVQRKQRRRVVRSRCACKPSGVPCHIHVWAVLPCPTD
jgi:hypothetical protein